MLRARQKALVTLATREAEELMVMEAIWRSLHDQEMAAALVRVTMRSVKSSTRQRRL